MTPLVDGIVDQVSRFSDREPLKSTNSSHVSDADLEPSCKNVVFGSLLTVTVCSCFNCGCLPIVTGACTVGLLCSEVENRIFERRCEARRVINQQPKSTNLEKSKNMLEILQNKVEKLEENQENLQSKMERFSLEFANGCLDGSTDHRHLSTEPSKK